MRLIELEVGPFMARCVIVADEGTPQALVVDPGFDVELVIKRLRREALEPASIVLTHAHIDHAYGVNELVAAFPGIPVLLHPEDLPLLRNLPTQAQMFGFPAASALADPEPLEDGQRLAVGAESLLVRHCPGHSPGHVVLIREHPQEPVAIVGDVLFAGSIGRTDLWGGSFEVLAHSIREVLYRLPAHTRVVPGHGPETTIGAEMAGNPFVPAL